MVIKRIQLRFSGWTHTLSSALSQPFSLVELIYSHSFNSLHVSNSQSVFPVKACFQLTGLLQPMLSENHHLDDSQESQTRKASILNIWSYCTHNTPFPRFPYRSKWTAIYTVVHARNPVSMLGPPFHPYLLDLPHPLYHHVCHHYLQNISQSHLLSCVSTDLTPIQRL